MVAAMILRFVTGNALISRAIRTAEYGFWASHVEAQMPDDTLLGAHFDGGVLARKVGYDKADTTREMFVHLPATTIQDDAFHAFLRGQLGKPYDLTAVEAIPVARDWTTPNAWFCSELQAAALRACGWFACDLAAQFSKITPRDLLLILSGRVVLPA
jgi:uncharacterized protein YycO